MYTLANPPAQWATAKLGSAGSAVSCARARAKDGKRSVSLTLMDELLAERLRRASMMITERCCRMQAVSSVQELC